MSQFDVNIIYTYFFPAEKYQFDLITKSVPKPRARSLYKLLNFSLEPNVGSKAAWRRRRGRGRGDGFVFESRLLAHPPFLWEGVTAKVDVDIMFSLGQIVAR